MPTDYEQLAARYDEDRARWSFPPDDVIAATRPRRVLDLGCGTGRWLVSQRSDDVALFGADPSAAMLAEAHAKQLPGLVRARAEALPFATAAFDYVVSSYAFHHFTDKERALDEVARVLSERGVFRINNVEPTAASDWWIYEFFPETIAIDAARFWTRDRLTAALDARGFVVAVQVDSGPREIPVVEAIAEAERRVVSQLALLDDAAYARGLTRLRQAGPTVTTTSSRLCLTATRRASA